MTTSLREKLEALGQGHLLRFEGDLTNAEREKLHRQIESIDFATINRWYREASAHVPAIDASSLSPMPVVELPKSDAEKSAECEAYGIGLDALKAGRVAAVLVAGGQGSRLGFEHPKGMFPIGPVSGASLFQIHAEKILAWSRLAGKRIPWFIMTSPGNDQETKDFFKANNYFGLPAEEIRFFVQGQVPAVDLETGRALLADRANLFLSPNGHGGTLTALKSEGILADLAKRGIDLLYYFQVDNPFVKVLEPTFLGHHLKTGAEVSLKVIKKREAAEKLGLIVMQAQSPTIIEYSDLPTEIGEKTDPAGNLLFWTGSIAIHVFSRPFLERITEGTLGLPVHFARKAVPFVDETGAAQSPKQPNALKFEMFIFDALPLASKVTAVETDRAEEYEPVKNAKGDHSPEVVKAAISRQACQWLRAVGVDVAVTADGEPTFPLEISPLAGVTPQDFKEKLADKSPIKASKYFKG